MTERPKQEAESALERKRAEDGLRESDERYRWIVENTTEGISVADSNFCITFVNRQMAEMLGYDPDEMLGRSVLDFVFPEDVEQKRQSFERRRAGLRERYEDRFRHKDGSAVSVQIGSTPIFKGSGEFGGALVMISDISERKRAEQVLRERDKELLEAQRVAQVGSWQWDPETDTVTWSEETYRIADRDPSLPPIGFREKQQLYAPGSGFAREAKRSVTLQGVLSYCVAPFRTSLSARTPRKLSGRANRDSATSFRTRAWA